jgi:RNA polymerase sigma-70 factor, ECF subfamily
MSKTEEQLIGESLAGEANAFGELYDSYVQRIYRYHYYRTFHKERAEDLTSQTFMNALEHLKDFDQKKGPFSAWIYRIARNLLIDEMRKAKPSVDIEDVWNQLPDKTNLAKDVELKEQWERVDGFLQTLPAEQRELLTMRLWDGLSYAEIAALTGKSEAACKMSVSRALASIKKQASVLALFLLLPHLLF